MAQDGDATLADAEVFPGDEIKVVRCAVLRCALLCCAAAQHSMASGCAAIWLLGPPAW